MRFWDWALERYARPGVQAACLNLQDKSGLNVPYLLWAAWLGQADPGLMTQGARLAHSFENDILSPLRSARRALRQPFAPLSETTREGLRAQAKSLELQAERGLMEGLESLGHRVEGAEASLRVLTSACLAWGCGPLPVEAIRSLADALDEGQ